MGREKVTETDTELHCAQLVQKCLFGIHLVSLFVHELVMSPSTQQDQVGSMTWSSWFHVMSHIHSLCWDFQEKLLYSYSHFFFNCLVTGKFISVGYTADGLLSDRMWQDKVCFMKSAVQEQCAAKEY
jgi:hypothetical protein